MAEKEEMDLRQDNPGRAWYVIHTYSGYENKVKANLERLIHTAGMKDMIFNIVVPVEEEVEIKDGKKKGRASQDFSRLCAGGHDRG